ncbi:MAG: glycine cleavage system aminomethyltransferase GcvT [Elusimicrobiaceae bacterium]|nr:glycine cleavage system aminomethyltransferase GcvT [Elusimicrobiaceae bacterium]
MAEQKKTALCTACEKAGGRMVDFHGWLLPVQFEGILAEHKAVRETAGMFDVSHMGQIFVEGMNAWPFLQYVSCNNIKNGPAEGTYFHLLTEQGTIIDDAISFCLSPEKFLIVVNAACVEGDFAWLRKQAEAFHVKVRNESNAWSMLAVQGPKAVEVINQLLPGVKDLPRFHISPFTMFGTDGYVTRTGYTGEDGVEIMLPNAKIQELWDVLLQLKVTPCGLGARDVLRLEAGYLLNGEDANPTKTPYEANCGWVVKLAKNKFIGKTALETKKEAGFPSRLVGFRLKVPGVPRAGCKIFYKGKEAGIVTSGTFSPLFKGIAVGYLDSKIPVEAETEIEIHGRLLPAIVVKPPFYKNRV